MSKGLVSGGRARDVWLAVALPSAVMLGLGFWNLGRNSAMGNDEAATRWAASLPLGELRHLLSNIDAVHGCYYLLMHAWSTFGSSPAALRVPSVFAMTGAVALTAIIGIRLTGSTRIGLTAGLVMALTPAVSFYAQTARSYAMVCLLVMAASLALIDAVTAEQAPATNWTTRRRWACYGGLVCASAYLNELALLMVIAHGVTMVQTGQSRRARTSWVVSVAAAIVIVSPLLWLSTRQKGALALPRPGLPELKTLFANYFGPSEPVALILLACAVVALLPAGHLFPATGRTQQRSHDAGDIPLSALALPLLVVPAGTLYLESLAAEPLFADRYVLFGGAGAALLAASGLDRIGRELATRRRRILAWAPAALAVALVVLLQVGAQQHTRTAQQRAFDYGGPAAFVGQHAQPGDGVLFFTAFFRKVSLGYPEQFRDVNDLAIAIPPAKTGDFRGRNEPIGVIQARMLQHQRIWVVGRRPTHAHPAGTFGGEQKVLLTHFACISTLQFHRVSVTLWQRLEAAPAHTHAAANGA